MSPLRALPFAILGLLNPLAEASPLRPVQDFPELARALDALRSATIQTDMEYLASPSRGGRSTPSPGLDDALSYVVQRLEAAGWSPGGADSWHDPFPLFTLAVDGELSKATVTGGQAELELSFGEQLLPERLGQLRGWDLNGPLVSIGAGNEEDLDGVELQGAWALLHEGAESIRGSVLRAQAAGAAGIVVTPGPMCRWREYDQRFQSVAKTMLRGIVTQTPARGGRQDDPAVVMIAELPMSELLATSHAQWPGKSEGLLPPAGVKLGLSFRDQRRLVDPKIQASNVVAFMPGTDPQLAREVILVTAHVDHLGDVRGELYAGANDNASGVAALLALADGLALRGPGRRSLALLFLVGMEKGSWGAKAWLADPSLPDGSQAVALLNLDRVGRLENEALYATPSPTHANYGAVAAAIAAPAAQEGLVLSSLDDQWTRLDTRVFAAAGLPVLTLSTGADEDTRSARDTLDKVDAESIQKVARTALRFVSGLDGELLGSNQGTSVMDGDGPGPPGVDLALQFGQDLIAAANQGDGGFFLNALDRRALVHRALQGSTAAASKAELAWLERASEVEHLWRRVVSICTDSGQYSVLRASTTPATLASPERCELLMRLARETDFDYHRLLLDRDSTGAVRVVDLHALSLDEWASATLARHHSMLISDPDSLADLRSGRAPRCLAPLEGLHAHYDDPELGLGMDLLKALPEDLAASRDYLRMGMLYTWGPRRADWAVARGRFEASFPNAQGAVIWAVCDTHGWDPEPAELPEALDAMEALTGDATYPTFLRGLHAMFAEQPGVARTHFERALALEPDFQETWWGMLDALKGVQDWPALTQHLDDFGAYFEVEFTPAEMLADPSLAEFVASEAFAQWKSRYDARHDKDK